jgi:hypothetical protein
MGIWPFERAKVLANDCNAIPVWLSFQEAHQIGISLRSCEHVSTATSQSSCFFRGTPSIPPEHIGRMERDAI